MNINVQTQVKSKVAEAMRKENFDNVVNNALMAREVNSYETIVKIKADKNFVIDTTKAYSVPSLLARLGYVSGSMIGIITNLIEVSGVLMDNQYNVQFVKEDGFVDILKLRKIFPTACIRGEKSQYKSIFSEEQNNIILVETKQGRRMKLIKALKSDIKRFVDEIETTSEFTQEDLVAIGKDLEKIGRVMQELEIDSAKDATIKEGMLKITDFMNAFTCKLASKNLIVTNNFSEIIKNKSAKIKKDIKFEYKIEEYESLDEAYDRAAVKIEELKTSDPYLQGEKLESAIFHLKAREVDSSLIEDAATELKKYMVAQQNVYLGQLVQLYDNADMKLFEQFKTCDVEVKTSIKDEIIKLTIRAIRMINNHFKYSSYMPMKKVDDLAKILRNAIYSYANTHEVDLRDAFLIACHAGWCKIDNYNNAEVINVGFDYKYAAISALFSSELKWYFNPEAMYTQIEVELPDNAGIELNKAYTFVEGECEIENFDGDVDFMFCTSEDDFEGIAICRMINDEPVFTKYINEFAYEQTEFITFDKVCDISLESNSYNAIEAKENPAIEVAAAQEIKDINTMNMSKEDSENALEKEASKLQPMFKNWVNYMQLTLVNENYDLYLSKINNGIYLNIKNNTTSDSKMLGRISHALKSEAINTYSSMDTIVCATGAITILNK